LALDLWGRVPDPVVAGGIGRIDLLLRTAEAANHSGQLQRAVCLAREAVDAIDADAEPLRAALANERLGRYLIDTYTMEMTTDEILDACWRAVELLPAVPPTSQRARVTTGLAEALLVARRYGEVRRWCDEALAVARAVDSGDDEARALMSLAMLELHRGDADTARGRLRESNDQNLWMALDAEGAHLPEDDLKSDSSDQDRRWRAGSGRYARAQGSRWGERDEQARPGRGGRVAARRAGP
jgi:hypothetical protein